MGLISRVSSRTYRILEKQVMVFPAMIAVNTVADFFDYIFESDAAAKQRHWAKDARDSRIKSSFPEPLSNEQLAELAKNLKAKGVTGVPDGADMGNKSQE